MSATRVRFAPSPTGPLHIGGVRTALYNYLFAKHHNGTFILRIEDTDQNRYVEGAEQYIIESLNWLGLTIDEGPGIGGSYGPYRQSERKSIYKAYAEKLVELGAAYYAFDTGEELAKLRDDDPTFKYSAKSRATLNNSLGKTQEEINPMLNQPNTVIRLKIPANDKITINDTIRGQVVFDTNELDDKVILKADGMPTYHLANIVDDHLMEISHVIRGEEWLSSTAHHVFMYNSLNWQAPEFAHLPLILKPTGKGKLSKRDGAKFGFPVFPLNWTPENEDQYPGFREEGYLPAALLNFLALLGWSPKNDEEIFSLNELIELFNLDNIVKSGARFDVDKALWFNQHYILKLTDEEIAEMISEASKQKGYDADLPKLTAFAGMMKERVVKISDMLDTGYYLFEKPKEYDENMLRKKMNEDAIEPLQNIATLINAQPAENAEFYSSSVKAFIQENNLKMGMILPLLRIALTGTMKGPDLFETIAFLGGKESGIRITELLQHTPK